MPSARDIRLRIRGVESTRQITRAMELVATSRLYRAQQAVLSRRPYAEKLSDVLHSLASSLPPDEGWPPLMEPRIVQNNALVVLTTSRGLCGALNTNTVRATLEYIRDLTVLKINPIIVNVGRVGERMLRGAAPVVASFKDMPERPGILDVLPISRLLIDGFRDREFDAVHIIFPEFVNTLTQRAGRMRLLPVVAPEEEFARRPNDFIYEPDVATVLGSILPRYVEVELYRTVLETAASEHSARMVAMRNATENATDLIDELTMEFNRRRQSTITSEMLDIASGANAQAR